MLGGFLHGGRRRRAAGNGERHGVEIAGADLALVFGGGVTIGLGCEFRFLKLGISRHLPVLVTARQFEHAEIQLVETGERNELELVAHCPEFPLELGNRRVVEVLFPVERRRAIVGELLAGMHLVHAFRKPARLLEIGL
ncbi:hypothetical protein D3C78_1230510 [compost metagenome]